MNQALTTIDRIYKRGVVVGKSGKTHKLHSEIEPKEGAFILDLVKNDSTILKTLEIGCAYGLSSLHICAGLYGRKQASHTILDPAQTTDWDSAGIINLQASGIDFFELLETKSEFALPKLLEKMEGKFDFVFVDGWHTFDHTLLDCFYATRLLKTGGYLVIDDVDLTAVSRVVSFLKKYPCYEVCGSVSSNSKKSWKKSFLRFLMFPIHSIIWAKILSVPLHQRIFNRQLIRMIAFKKIAADNRNWDWHNDTF